MTAKAKTVVFTLLVITNPVVVGLTLGWVFSLEGTLGLYKWRPNYRLYFNAVGCLGIVAPVLAVITVVFRRFSDRIGEAFAIVTACVAVVGLAVPITITSYFLSYSLQLSDTTPPVLLLMDGSGANGVPNLALAFRTHTPSKNVLRYGEDRLDKVVTEDQPTHEHVIALKDLKPATRYQWQLNDGEIYSFLTPRAEATSAEANAVVYHFGVSGDSHIGRAIDPDNPAGDLQATRSTLRTVIASENPFHTFFIVGDMTNLGMYDDYWIEVLDTLALSSYSVPMRPILGNHDSMINGVPHYLAYFYPAGLETSIGTRLYYRIDSGPVHFILLKFLWSTTESFTPDERAWFIRQVESIPQEDWTIVMMHTMVYASGSEELGLPWYDPPEMILEIAPLFEKHKVDLVISGHDHQMEFLQKNGVSYCVIGAFGGLLSPNPAHISPASVWHNNTTFGFLDATVYPETINLCFRDTTGSELRGFTVSKNR